MEKPAEATVEFAQEQIDIRALLNVEILLIGGGENVTSLF